MSTKIYNGYRLPGDADLFELLHALRQGILPLYEDAYATAVTRKATFDTDDIIRGATNEAGTPKTSNALLAARLVAERAHQEISRSGLRNPEWDLGFDLTVLADPVSADHRFALIFTEQDSYRRRWAGLPGVEPYGYWNNSDQPDGVTDEEWGVRRSTWERVIPAFSPPSTVGFTWSMLTGTHNVSESRLVELAADRIPTKLQRATRIARDTVVSRALPPDPRMSDVLGTLRDPAVNAEILSEAERLAETIHDISVEDLLKVRDLIERCGLGR